MTEPSESTPLARRLIAPLALSSRTAAVACEAKRWARLLGADLLLLHVGRDTPQTRQRFEQLLQEHGMGTAPLEFRAGKAGKAIVRAAADLRAHLIVAGALENEPVLTYYVGSVARQIARHATCSVLLLRDPMVDARPTRRWVVTVRRDTASRRMLDFMAQVAQRERPDRLDVVSEYDLSGASLALEADLDVRAAEEQRQRIHREEHSRMLDFLADSGFEYPHLRPVCLRGRIGYASADYARRQGADLLIAAAPRRFGLWDKFIQHGVEFALEALPCALWLYRPASDEKLGTGPTGK